VVLAASLASVISNDRFPHEVPPGHGLQWPGFLLASMPCCPHGRSRSTTSPIQLAVATLGYSARQPISRPRCLDALISIYTQAPGVRIACGRRELLRTPKESRLNGWAG
jgi:hypothetical protein